MMLKIKCTEIMAKTEKAILSDVSAVVNKLAIGPSKITTH